MPTVQRGDRVRVTFPDTMAVSDGPAPRGRTRRFREFAPPVREAPLASELLSSLEELGLQPIADVPLHTLEEPSDPIRRRRRGAPGIPPVQEVTLTADLTEGERAVALIEQDGLYSWTFGETETLPDERARGLRRAGAAPPGPATRVRFTVPLHASSSPARRTRLFGMERVFRPVRAFIFTFPARLVVGQVVKHLERDVETGLLRLVRAGAEGWEPLADPSSLEFPEDRPARVLLLVHGTFSSTTGAFGALGVTDYGTAFLTDLLARYDAVLGFDHRTLGVDPLENAGELLAELGRLPATGRISFDAVAHSRGGLVLRSLVEHLAPAADLDASFERLIFVGSTNGGTALADPENWHRLIDLYTNLAIGSMKALSLAAPQTAPITATLTGMLRGLAAFVKALATTVIDEQQVLGLAAMNPRGRFVADLNRTQPGQPTPETIDCYAVTSDFEPGLADEQTLPAKLLRALADGAVDRLMGERNDLVVDVDSMTEVDPHVSGFIDDVLAFPANGLVHHTNYFHHEATVKALGRWLRLEELELPAGWDRGEGRVTPLPSPYVDDDIVVVSAEAPGRSVREMLRSNPSDWVVVRRPLRGSAEVYHYAYRPHELDTLLDDERNMAEILDLHESSSSSDTPVQLVTGFDPRDPVEGQPQMARTVAIGDDDPVGVVPGLREMRMATPAAARAPLPPPVAHSERTAVTPLGGGRTRRSPAARRARSTARMAAPTDEASPPATPASTRASHSFRAEMPREIVVGSDVSVELTVSREVLAVVAGRAGAAATADVELDRNLIVDVRPRRGFDLVGDGRREIEPLHEGEGERAAYFDVRATDVGPGEIDVVIRQGQVPLVTLKLEPIVVAEPSGETRRLTSADARVSDVPPLAEPIHELTIWEQETGGETRLRFVFESPGLNIRDSARSEAIAGGTAGYVARVYADIEDRWRDRTHSAETFTKDLRAIGMTMFEELVPLPIRQVLWAHRDRITNIQVISEEPHVPWEIVHLKDPAGSGRGGRFLGELGVVRWMENLPRNGFGPEHVDIGTVLAIVPEYPEGSDWVLEEPAREFAYLEETFGAVKVEPRREDVDRLLETPGSFDLLHYAGHGEAPTEGTIDASLVLGVQASEGRWVTEELDADTVLHYALLTEDERRPMVVLNACQVGRMQRRLGGTGGFARAFLTAGAGIFVSSLWAVGDEPARTFVESFYQGLLAGQTVSEATISARLAARDAGDLTWLAYTVYAHPHAKVAIRSPGGGGPG